MRSIVILTFGLLICFSGLAQQDELQQKTINYLESNGTQAQYEGAYDQMLELIQSQFKGVAVPKELWNTLATKRQTSVANMLNMLASVYSGYFNAEDIQRLTDHYGGSLEQQQQGQSAFLNSPTGQKLISVQNQLIENISKTSEYWSRDLYLESMEFLKEKGFTPKQQ